MTGNHALEEKERKQESCRKHIAEWFEEHTDLEDGDMPISLPDVLSPHWDPEDWTYGIIVNLSDGTHRATRFRIGGRFAMEQEDLT